MTLEAVVGSQTTYYFTVTDDGNEPPMVFVIGNQPENAALTKMDEQTYHYTFTLDEPVGFNLSFVANDSLGATSLLDPQMLLCGCVNSSDCTMLGVLAPSADPLVLECDCSAGIHLLSWLLPHLWTKHVCNNWLCLTIRTIYIHVTLIMHKGHWS